MNYLNRFKQYFHERFNLGQFVFLSLLLCLIFWASSQFYLYQQIKEFAPLVYSSLALFLFLLKLRLLDEFKDYAHDKKFHPERPVSRGLIKLNELKPWIIICLLLEILIAIIFTKTSIFLYGIVLIYSLLMYKEFFCAEKLRKNFTLYILLHEIIIIPLSMYLLAINKIPVNAILDEHFILIIGFVAIQLFLLEVARKIRSKDQETAGNDTYTSQYGTKKAAILLSVLSIIIVAVITGGLSKLGLTLTLFSAIGYNYIIGKFMFAPNSKNAKNVFTSSILFVFLIDVIYCTNLFK